MNESIFKTKIVQRFEYGREFYELLLPNGNVVFSGSLEGCWDAREEWEMKIDTKAPKKCQLCKCWMYSVTLGSPDVPVWHCRYGFTPSHGCQDMAEYNLEGARKMYREHPEWLQLKLNF